MSMVLQAFFEIVVLDCAIAATIAQFHKINETASYMLIPYFAWVSFASALSYSIWQKNKDKELE